jgi:ribonuclease P protein component
MFAKSHRFSFKKGAPRRIYQTPLFVIRYDKNNDKKLHCAVVVGKKVDKRAVVRNTIKRQLNITIKELLSLDTEYNIVIFAKKLILSASKEERYEELKKSFKSINII